MAIATGMLARERANRTSIQSERLVAVDHGQGPVDNTEETDRQHQPLHLLSFHRCRPCGNRWTMAPTQPTSEHEEEDPPYRSELVVPEVVVEKSDRVGNSPDNDLVHRQLHRLR